jgi:hypothetical protein
MGLGQTSLEYSLWKHLKTLIGTAPRISWLRSRSLEGRFGNDLANDLS